METEEGEEDGGRGEGLNDKEKKKKERKPEREVREKVDWKVRGMDDKLMSAQWQLAPYTLWQTHTH